MKRLVLSLAVVAVVNAQEHDHSHDNILTPSQTPEYWVFDKENDIIAVAEQSRKDKAWLSYALDYQRGTFSYGLILSTNICDNETLNMPAPIANGQKLQAKLKCFEPGRGLLEFHESKKLTGMFMGSEQVNIEFEPNEETYTFVSAAFEQAYVDYTRAAQQLAESISNIQ